MSDNRGKGKVQGPAALPTPSASARPATRSPWRRGPMCDTHGANLSFARYVARGRRMAKAVGNG